MIKEILVLLWILIIPLGMTVRRLYQTYAKILPQQKQIILEDKKSELVDVIIKISMPMLLIPLGFISENAKLGLSVSLSDILRGILSGEIIIVDLAMVVFYFELENSIVKKFFTFLFVIINFWISALWAIRGELSLTVLWISVIAYFAFGVERIVSYYLEKGKSS